MPFTPEEIRRWKTEMRKREIEPSPASPQAIVVCVHCQMPFGINAGVVTDDVAICDVCNGD